MQEFMQKPTQKPFPQSYWVIEGLLCAGQYPGALDANERSAKLAGLLDCGIRRVINLIPSHETGRDGAPFEPYAPLLQTLAASRGLTVECLRLGYPDGTTPERSHMRDILDIIDASMAAGEAVYVHCWGGHGRTGTTAACYLIRHGQSAEEAIAAIKAWRKTLPKNHDPFEGQQEAFVRFWHFNE
jgi:hypothetical protein